MEVLLEAINLTKFFPLKKGVESIFTKEKLLVHAVDGVSFQIGQNEVLGLAGESGCGKTTIGRLLTLLEKPTNGNVIFKGVDITNSRGRELKTLRKSIQMIFQDPYTSLNPRQTVFDAVCDPLICHKIGSKDERSEIVYNALEQVELMPLQNFLFKYPNELSGGERQRVVIARATVLNPECIIADEPVSMLDSSIRTGILNVLMKLKKERGITYLFITHDLSTLRYISDRIAMMYVGKIVEIGQTQDIITNPMHPYTKILRSAVPIANPTYKRKRVIIPGEVHSSIDPPKNCRFNPRCPNAQEICKKEEPKLKEIKNEHFAACHFI